jgi:hypothetical protein
VRPRSASRTDRCCRNGAADERHSGIETLSERDGVRQRTLAFRRSVEPHQQLSITACPVVVGRFPISGYEQDRAFGLACHAVRNAAQQPARDSSATAGRHDDQVYIVIACVAQNALGRRSLGHIEQHARESVSSGLPRNRIQVLGARRMPQFGGP